MPQSDDLTTALAAHLRLCREYDAGRDVAVELRAAHHRLAALKFPRDAGNDTRHAPR